MQDVLFTPPVPCQHTLADTATVASVDQECGTQDPAAIELETVSADMGDTDRVYIQYMPKKSSHYGAIVRSDRSKISTVVLRRSYGSVDTAVPKYAVAA